MALETSSCWVALQSPLASPQLQPADEALELVLGLAPLEQGTLGTLVADSGAGLVVQKAYCRDCIDQVEDEEMLVPVEDTSQVGAHRACQDSLEDESHIDREDQNVDLEEDSCMGNQAVGTLAAPLHGLVAGCKETDFDCAGEAEVAEAPDRDFEVRMREFQRVENSIVSSQHDRLAVMICMKACFSDPDQKEGNGAIHTTLRFRWYNILIYIR